MYLDFYGLEEAPFSITPDPRYVFLSERHRDALAHLLYGIGKGGSGGFVQLTGEVGTGKTTLSRLLLEQLPEDTRVALVLNPRLSPVELVEVVCEELGLDTAGKQGSLKALTDTLNAYLLEAYAQGLRVVLIIDEAQALSDASLEQVRLLTNLETPTQKLLQVILIGQPELREVLGRSHLRQLAQRITARYHLTPLNAEESEQYVRHRLAVAGCPHPPFSRLAMRALYRHSKGIPRLINIIADRALMAGYAREQAVIGESLLNRAALEALPSHARTRWWRRARWALAGLATLLLLVTAVVLWQARTPPAPLLPPQQPDNTAIALQQLRETLPEVSGSELSAITQVLARWRIDSSQVSIQQALRCPARISAGVHCLRGSASLAQVTRFGRPVILLLDSAAGKAHAVLLGAGKKNVLLDVAGERYTLRRSDLGELWQGEFIALWTQPEVIPAMLKQGDRHTAVALVRRRLAGFDGIPAGDVPDNLFDEPLSERVRALQRSYGINADGIIGPETLFALSALDDHGPHLARSVN